MFGELANNSIFLCKRKLKVNQSVFCSPTRGHVVQLGNVCCRTVVRPFIMLQCQYYLFKHLRFSKKQIHKKKGVTPRVQNSKRLNLRVELMGDFYWRSIGWRICKIILAWSLNQNICDSSFISLNVNKKQYHLHTCDKIQTNYVGGRHGAAIFANIYTFSWQPIGETIR